MVVFFQDCPKEVQEAMQDTYDHNIAIAVSAGNEDIPASDRIFARCNYIIPTASTSSIGTRSSFSNYGHHIVIAAPGENIPLTGNNGYASGSGTSYAAPHVAGTIALMLSLNPDLTMPQIIEILQKTVKPFGSTPDKIIGPGILNTLKAVECVHHHNDCLEKCQQLQFCY